MVSGHINRLADLLALEGDHDPVGVRRSKAIGIIAQPAMALEMLAGIDMTWIRSMSRIPILTIIWPTPAAPVRRRR